MLALGTLAPDFNLYNTITGKEINLEQARGDKGTVVMFICNHCPFVIHVIEELVRVAQTYQKLGIKFVAISSNDVENYPQDAPELMKETAEKLGYPSADRPPHRRREAYRWIQRREWWPVRG